MNLHRQNPPDAENPALAQNPRIAIVVGMKSEARIADVGHDLTIVGGGSAAQVEAGLARVHIRAKAQGRPLQGVLSFGVAGGLAPHLRPGDILLPHAVQVGAKAYTCHAGWTEKLSRRLTQAHVGALLGVDEPILTPEHKRRLHGDHGALAVDMESHGAARFAAAHGLPFAVLRAVADPQRRAIPRAAMAGFKPDGSADIAAVIKALARSPSQVGGLIRTAFDARAGMEALLRSRRLLGASFGFDDFV
ncbi:phosphorylase [uncultured Rhodoblastus sp.]|uniref:phosphorylase family protein n=1 Tax=uncultured Rhodoblastus sp. TaxID=543037 RepID=UPI0025DE3E28|nr:phosphorylase [uncultured Rhodoblastus sp.]